MKISRKNIKFDAIDSFEDKDIEIEARNNLKILTDLKSPGSLYFVKQQGKASMEYEKQILFYCYTNAMPKGQIMYWDGVDCIKYPIVVTEESCQSLTHKKCWDPTSELNTSRELGIGVGQISKAYDKNGKVRFDSLADMVKLHNKELHELSWSNVKQRPDLQIRTMILMSEDNYKALYNIKDPIARMEFTDSAYNTGLGGVYRSRRLCGLTKGCDAQAWFNNGVSSTCDIGHKVLYGNRTACDINLDHVSNIFKIRMNKYKVFFINKE